MLRSLASKGVGLYLFRNFERSTCPSLRNEMLSSWSLEGKLLSTLSVTAVNRFHNDSTSGLLQPPPQTFYQPCRGYAARKGTRARKAAKKVKKEEVKKVFIFKKLRKLAAMPYQKQRPFDDSHYPLPIDDVYFLRKFQKKKYPFEEAIQCLREAHHPTVYNVPDAPLFLRVNMDFKYPNRTTKCMDGWRSVVEMKSPFLLEGMKRPSVLAFCIEDVDYIEGVVKEGGADRAGGKEVIKAIQMGDINPDEYEYMVAHPNIVPELTSIRGLIKRKFPTIRNRTISTDLIAETKRLKAGVKIQVVTNDREPDFGYIFTPIGTLDMDGLIENFRAVVLDALPRRVAGKEPKDFIISCVLSTPNHGFEEFKIDLDPFFEEYENSRTKKKVAAEAEA